jgi:hypothetical protein
MEKRQFLGAALAGGALPALAAAGAAAPKGPTLLTVTGAIAAPNRGPFDAFRDQMMHKQKLGFTKAFAFDFAMLTALPAVEIAPTLEYDATAHRLRGPLLADVLAAAGARVNDASTLLLRAVDGYASTLTLGQARARRMIVATHLDGQPMALGGLGPLWGVIDADRIGELASLPLAQRFANCPWALYHIALPA